MVGVSRLGKNTTRSLTGPLFSTAGVCDPRGKVHESRQAMFEGRVADERNVFRKPRT